MAEEAVVLRDGEGNYYLLPKQTLGAARVPADQVAALEETLEPEVAGHAMSLGGFELIGMVGGSGLARPPRFPHIDFAHVDVAHLDGP